MKIIDKTVDFYEKNHKELISKYNSANLEKLHLLFKKQIKPNNRVLDIGFGSGRDLRYIHSLGANCYGVEACKGFLESLQKDKVFRDRVFYSKLPNLELPFEIKFNAIILTAVIMHLSINEIEKSIIEIKKYLKDNGVVIVSYSIGNRENDERFFEKLDRKIVNDIFLKNGFYQLESIKNYDGMQREIEWITTVYKI